jgi:hypothetical protein
MVKRRAQLKKMELTHKWIHLSLETKILKLMERI